MTYAQISTPVYASRSASERPWEDLLSWRLQKLSISPSTDVSITGNVCCEASLEITHVEESSMLQLEQVCIVEETKFPELQFSHGYILGNNKQILVVTQCHLAYYPPFGYISWAWVTRHEDGSHKVHILMWEIENSVAWEESKINKLLKRFSANSTYKFCPGIEWSYYREWYFEVIRFNIKIVRHKEAPFYHINSVNCNI